MAGNKKMKDKMKKVNKRKPMTSQARLDRGY